MNICCRFPAGPESLPSRFCPLCVSTVGTVSTVLVYCCCCCDTAIATSASIRHQKRLDQAKYNNTAFYFCGFVLFCFVVAAFQHQCCNCSNCLPLSLSLTFALSLVPSLFLNQQSHKLKPKAYLCKITPFFKTRLCNVWSQKCKCVFHICDSACMYKVTETQPSPLD